MVFRCSAGCIGCGWAQQVQLAVVQMEARGEGGGADGGRAGGTARAARRGGSNGRRNMWRTKPIDPEHPFLGACCRPRFFHVLHNSSYVVCFFPRFFRLFPPAPPPFFWASLGLNKNHGHDGGGESDATAFARRGRHGLTALGGHGLAALGLARTGEAGEGAGVQQRWVRTLV